ncbi:LacI family DNA-binding transcriptional regulator [Acidipropionibacterium virtanenii]|uniref:HTH-type transcriptional regulator DegA n=1 Tax=Acidipropionibacterium virtanenii TaxID=2057246 RepID=A0A344UXR4_9ACTN|nr:LacI family DNA-binding transcriptional regulator [Acidipropionibacterium virtanenii]AXE40062.1 HTH-type transcriptional regulator DegA [Acidipropionibacterium virtanenii]
MSPTGRRRYVTQADVARRAGVSRPLVSLVMQGSEHVSDDKRRRVLAAAAELGYLNNGVATSLAGNRSRMVIGFLAQSLANPVFVDVYENLDEQLKPQGHSVVVMQGGFDPDEEDRSLRNLVTLRPDGLVVVGYAGSTSALEAAVNSLPVVAVTRQIEMDGVSSVYSDDRLSSELAVEHLAGLGHRDIVHLALPADIPYEERADGFREAMKRRGLPDRVVHPQLSAAGATRAVDALVSAGTLPTALFCGNDVLATGALAGLSAHGLEVPGDVSVVGHDNTAAAAQSGLTSVDQHAGKQGRLAADVLMRMIERRDLPSATEKHRLSPRMKIRRSTAAPR